MIIKHTNDDSKLLPNGMFPTNIDREWSCWNKY